jgi:hypothetical protein
MKDRLEIKFASKQIMKQCEYTLVTLMKAIGCMQEKLRGSNYYLRYVGYDIDGTMRGISDAAP